MAHLSPTSLVHCPEEVVRKILLDIPTFPVNSTKDIARCALTCRTLNNIIQFNLHLFPGYQDARKNHLIMLSVQEKLSQETEGSQKNFKKAVRSAHKIWVNHTSKIPLSLGKIRIENPNFTFTCTKIEKIHSPYLHCFFSMIAKLQKLSYIEGTFSVTGTSKNYDWSYKLICQVGGTHTGKGIKVNISGKLTQPYQGDGNDCVSKGIVQLKTVTLIEESHHAPQQVLEATLAIFAKIFSIQNPNLQFRKY